MIDPTQAALFLDLQKYLFGLGHDQFVAFARGAWPDRWEHMCTKWLQQCNQNPWVFCCRLDPGAFKEMVLYYNQLGSPSVHSDSSSVS